MRNTNKIILLGLFSLIWVIVFLASSNVIWLGDDYYYQFIFEKDHTPLVQDNPTPIENIGDIFLSQFNHYFNYNGRSVAHFFVQLFCGILGPKWFAFFNGLAYIALILCFVIVIRGNLNNFRTWLSVIILFFISFIIKITPSSQVGYIWIAILELIFIKIFLEGKSYKCRQLILLFLFSIISGNGHEAYSIGISVGIIIYWITNLKHFGLTRYVTAIGYGIGTLLICLSPATLSRTQSHTDHFQSLFFFLFSIKAVYILLAVVIYKLCTHKESLKSLYLNYAFFWNIWISCIIFNLVIGVFCDRQLLGAEMMSIILILRICKDNSLSKFWLCLLGCVALLNIWFNLERVCILKKQEERIYMKYIQSKDGKVYQDTWGTGLTNIGWASYLWENSFHTKSFRRKIHRQFPEGPELTILPEYLAGKDTVDIGNKVYHFKYKPGKLLIIQSKISPAKFYVKREFFGFIPYQTREMDYNTTWYETPYWRALIYDNLNPIIYNTDVIIE